MAIRTWAQALADPHVKIHWVLVLLGQAEVGVPGGAYRFADAPLDIEGVHYQGALEMDTNPGVYVDPYTSESNSPNAVVSLLPLPDGGTNAAPLRPYDLEKIIRLDFLGWRARLYRWADGTAWSDAQLLLNGYIHEPELDADGVLHLTIADRILRHNCKLPRRWVTEVRWPSAYAEDYGRGQNILYGDFTRIPAPVVHAASKYAAIADGTIGSVTSVRVDDVADAGAPATLATTTDAKGDTVSIVTLTSAPGDSRIDASGTGYKDDALGTYSGTASATLTHPADQLHHMLRTFLNVRAADIDIPSFVGVRSDLPGFTSSIQATGEYMSEFFAIKDDVASLFRIACYAELGLFRLRSLEFNRPAVMRLRENETISKTEPIRSSDRSQLITSLVIRYAWRWLKKSSVMGFARSFEMDESDNAGFDDNAHLLRGDSNTAIERQRLLESRVIQETTTAELVAARLAELHGKPRKMLKLTVTRDAGHDLRIFDVVRVWLSTYPSADGLGAQGVRYVVTGITYGLDDDKLQLLEC